MRFRSVWHGRAVRIDGKVISVEAIRTRSRIALTDFKFPKLSERNDGIAPYRRPMMLHEIHRRDKSWFPLRRDSLTLRPVKTELQL